MKPRARRITIGAAALVAGVVAVLVLANWATVRDHVKAWHFQATTKTEVFEPFLGLRGKLLRYEPGNMIQALADYSGCRVVFDANYTRWFLATPSEPARAVRRSKGVTPDVNWIAEIEFWGWRVLQQRFPRRAYVLIRAADRWAD